MRVRAVALWSAAALLGLGLAGCTSGPAATPVESASAPSSSAGTSSGLAPSDGAPTGDPSPTAEPTDGPTVATVELSAGDAAACALLDKAATLDAAGSSTTEVLQRALGKAGNLDLMDLIETAMYASGSGSAAAEIAAARAFCAVPTAAPGPTGSQAAPTEQLEGDPLACALLDRAAARQPNTDSWLGLMEQAIDAARDATLADLIQAAYDEGTDSAAAVKVARAQEQCAALGL